MKEKNFKIVTPKNIILLIVACTLIHILYISPMLSDDFEFASYHFNNIGKIMRYSLYYGNGRLLGNIGACILNNNRIVCVIVKVVMILAMMLLIPKVINIKNKVLEYIIYLMLLGTAPEIFGQVFVWTSGFQNYIPPIVFMLACMWICKCYSKKSYQLFCIIIMGFTSQLYVEHCTIIHIMIAGLYLIYYMREENDVKKKCSKVWLLSTVVGAICMFLIPKLFFIENNRTKGYRAIHLNGVADLINAITTNAFTLLNTYSKCVFLWIIFCILGILLLRMVGQNKIDKLMVIIFCIYPIISIFDQITNWSGILRHICILGGMCLCSILVIINVFRLKNNKVKVRLFICIVFCIASVVPMLIVTPFAERNVFLSYIFLISFIISALDYVLIELNIKITYKLTTIICVLMVIGIICLDHIFVNVKKYSDMRETYIVESMERKDTRIDIFQLPSRYMFSTYLMNQYYYYQKRGDIEFILMNYQEWEKDHNDFNRSIAH